MKKFLVTIILGVCLFLGGSVIAQVVGEPMPNLDNALLTFSDIYTAEGKNFVFCLYDVDGVNRYNVAYVICDGVMLEKPVGIFDVKTAILYLDNILPNDGIIDAMVSEAPYPKIIDTIPFCE